MNTNEHEHDEDVMEYNIIDAETFVDLYGADALQELVTDEICPECGEEVDISKDKQTSIMIKAVCSSSVCDFAYCASRKETDKFLK